MALTAGPVFERSQHLVALVAEVERLAAAVGDVDPSGDVVADLRSQACVATLRLDGSTIPGPPADSTVAALQARAGTATDTRRAGTWLDALQTYVDLDGGDDEEIWALEFLGAERALAADDLTATVAADFVSALTQLHGRLTAGLVAPDAAGAKRLTNLAVQDGSIGRIVYFPADAATIERDLHVFAAWLQSAAAREHGLVASGVALFEILRLHPFLSANGRLARTAARLLLRERGLDPHGLAVAEIPLAADPLVLYEQVASSMRRRDLTIWLETWGEAVTGGLRLTAQRTGRLTAEIPGRADAFLATRSAGGFSIADYRADAGVGPEECRADLQALLDAGLVTRVLGSRGLRFRALPRPVDV